MFGRHVRSKHWGNLSNDNGVEGRVRRSGLNIDSADKL
jgi:hypothetical protein